MTTITAYGHTIEVESLPAKSIEYLLTYGFKQSVADASASPAAEAKKKGASEAEVQAAVDKARATRVEAILAGTVGMRAAGGGNGLTKLERKVREVGMEYIEALAKKKGISLRAPKGADEATREAAAEAREALFQKFLTAKQAEWTAEAERRLAAVAADTEEGEDDLFAGFAKSEEEGAA